VFIPRIMPSKAVKACHFLQGISISMVEIEVNILYFPPISSRIPYAARVSSLVTHCMREAMLEVGCLKTVERKQAMVVALPLFSGAKFPQS
jgi:hypothetical protein